MISLPRRDFLKLGALGAGVALSGSWARAQNASSVLLQGGTVIDPANGLHAIRDVLLTGGRIQTVGRIPADGQRAGRVIDATGLLVVPGLVDLHAHVGTPDTSLGLPVDEFTARNGVTTCVSAGDVGAPDWARFETEVLERARTRVFTFLHVSDLGLQTFPNPEMLNLGDIAVDRLAETVAANADRVLGIKVRESLDVVGDNGIEPLRRALAAAEQAGGGARVMCHIGNAPGELPALLELLRPGDILTHCFSGLGNNIVQDGRLLPAAQAAQQRGVIFDVGHGGGSFDFAVAEAALDQGLRPNTISSDLHRASMPTPGRPFLPWIMSKFLMLGFTLDEVVAMTTVRPAGIINRVEGLGTLSPGGPADVTLLRLVEAETDFVDTTGKHRTGDRYLEVAGVIRAGQVVV